MILRDLTLFWSRNTMETMVKTKGQAGKPSYTDLVPAVEQAGRILICLAQNAPARMKLTDLCKSVGIHKSKGYSILNTLQKFGFVQRDVEGKLYALGPGLISLGRKVLDSLNVGKIAEPFLERLAGQTHSMAAFGLIADDNVFVIGKQEGGEIGLTIRIGHRYRITHGAHGKAVVAFMPEAERSRILAQPRLYFHGDPSRFDPERLERELERCRQEGYAEDVGQMNPKINTVAAPVFASAGQPIGVMFVVGLFSKSLVRQYGALAAQSARQVSELLGANAWEIFSRASNDPTDRPP